MKKFVFRYGCRNCTADHCSRRLFLVWQRASGDGCSPDADGKIPGQEGSARGLGSRDAKDRADSGRRSDYLAGAQLCKDNCAVRHGLPGQPATAIARGMFPTPPELLHGKGVTDDVAGETYWKVVHGIRLTGMPGFRGSLTDT